MTQCLLFPACLCPANLCRNVLSLTPTLLNLPHLLSFTFPPTLTSYLFSLPFQLLPTSPLSFKRVLQVDPMDTKAMSSLALAYVDRGATEEAIHWFRRTVEVDPTSRAPLYNLAVVMTRSKRHAEALPLLSQLLAVSA